jgi:hypothetical protein
MNTPAHAVINLLCLGQRSRAKPWMPIVIGAILPDAPMFVFYSVRYWDPSHYGGIVAPLEILAVLVSCGLLWRTLPSWPSRFTLGTQELLVWRVSQQQD